MHIHLDMWDWVTFAALAAVKQQGRPWSIVT